MSNTSNLPQGRRWQDLTKAEQKQIALHLQTVNATQPTKQPLRKRGQFELRGYVRCELSASEKEAFLAWEDGQTPAALYEGLVKALDSGYLVKLGQNQDGYQASLCAYSTNSSWDGYVLVAHAGTPGRVWPLLWYKHSVVMQSQWAEWLDEGGEEFFR